MCGLCDLLPQLLKVVIVPVNRFEANEVETKKVGHLALVFFGDITILQLLNQNLLPATGCMNVRSSCRW